MAARVNRNGNDPITTGLIRVRLIFQIVPGVQAADATYVDASGAKRSVFHAGMKVEIGPAGGQQSTLTTGNQGEVGLTWELGSVYSFHPSARTALNVECINPDNYVNPPDTSSLALSPNTKPVVLALAHALAALSERLGYQSPGVGTRSMINALDMEFGSAIPLSAERALVAAERWLDSRNAAQDCRFPLGNLGLLMMLQRCDVPGSVVANVVVHGRTAPAPPPGTAVNPTQAIGALAQWKRWDLTAAERVPLPLPMSWIYADNCEILLRIVFARFERVLESVESLSRDGRAAPLSFVTIETVDGLPTVAMTEGAVTQVRLVSSQVNADAVLAVDTSGPAGAWFASSGVRSNRARLKAGGIIEIEAGDLPAASRAQKIDEAPRAFVAVSTAVPGEVPTVIAVLQVVVWPRLQVGLKMYLPQGHDASKKGLAKSLKATIPYLNAMYSQAGIQFVWDGTFGVHKLTTTVRDATVQPRKAPKGETLPIRVQAINLATVTWATPSDQIMTPDALAEKDVFGGPSGCVPVCLIPEEDGVQRLEIRDALGWSIAWGCAHLFFAEPRRPARFIVMRASGIMPTSFARILGHEIGHLLGLRHPYVANIEVFPQVVAPEVVDSMMHPDGQQYVVEPRLAKPLREARGKPLENGIELGPTAIRTGYGLTLCARVGWALQEGKPEVDALREHAERLRGGGYL